MAFTAGALSQVSVSDTKASVSSAVAVSGTTPYTYQWYRSVTSGFSPGGGNIIAGATSLLLNDSGLIPSTTYYYKVIATDAATTPLTATSAQLAVSTTQPVQNPNAFAQSSQLGMLDMKFNYDTVAVQIDSSQSGSLYAGQAVKMVDSADGVPKVIGCTASTDEALGFINFDIKSQSFVAGQRAEISMAGNVMYLYATGAIARGAQVCLDVTSVGGVSALVSSQKIVGWALDKASAAGALIRVFIKTPSYTVAP